MALDSKLDLTPKDLNFVVYGDITFKFKEGSFTCPGFRIA
jgi:hypothetical protein